MNESPVRLDLPFLGQRQYIQGTTLFDALLPFIPGQAKISFKIPHLIKSDRLELINLRGVERIPDSLAASLIWGTPAETGGLGVMPLPPSERPRRIAYDESQINSLAKFTGGLAELDRPSPFSFAGTIVSLNKAMLLQQFPKNEPGRWLFVRLDLSKIPENFIPLSLTLNNIIGGRIAKTEIKVGGFMIGDLYFSWCAQTLQEQ